MPTIIDLSQVVHASIAQEAAQNSVAEFGADFIRHMILDSLRANILRNRDNGQFIVACDNGSWRRQVFPEYKWRRRQARKEQAEAAIKDDKGPDWEVVGDLFREIKIALKLYFPIRVIDVEGCEGDDIIGRVALTLPERGRLHIISGDKDFQQLQRRPDAFGETRLITQYSPTLAKDIICEDPNAHLKSMVLRGDGGDGIPSVLSPDNHFTIEGARQRPITKPMAEEWQTLWDDGDDSPFFEAYEAGTVWPRISRDPNDPKGLTADTLRRRVERNKRMIDLYWTPESLKKEIDAQMAVEPPGDIDSAMRYMAAKGLRRLMDRVSDFGV